MLLKYDIAVVGFRQVDRALSGIERRLQIHNARSARILGQPTRATAAARAVPRTAKADGLAGSFAQIARAGMTADRQRYSAQQRLESNAHRQRISNLRAEQRAAMQASRAASREFRQRTGATVATAGSAVGGVGRVGLAATGLAGGAMIASQLANASDLERRQRQVIINSRAPGAQNAIEYSDLRSRVGEAAISTGASKSGITAGLEVFVQKTGDIKTAVDNMQTFATVAMATGADVADVFSAAADLSTKFKITNVEDMADAFATLAFQGKKGAFELRDMAENFPEMAAAAQRSGLSGTGGLRTFGGLAQIARQSTGSGSEASTAVQMMLTQLVAESGKLRTGEALGGRKVNIFKGEDATTGMRPVEEVLADVISASRGDLEQLYKIFDLRGTRAVSPMISGFREAFEGAGGGAAGEEAGRAAVVKMIADASETGATFADVQRDASDALRSTSAQLEILNSKLSAAIESELLPALTRLIPLLTNMVPHFAAVVEALSAFLDWARSNPLAGIGAIIAGKVLADLAMSGLAGIVRAFFIETLAGAAAGAAGGKAAAGVAAGVSALSGGSAAAVGAGGMAAAGIAGGARGALAGAAAGLGVAGAGLAAGAGLGAAYLSNEALKEESGGLGALDILAGMFSQGTINPFEVVDKHQNEQARNVAEQQRKDGEAVKMQAEAARIMLEAATKMSTGTLNRGNTPSPVKG